MLSSSRLRDAGIVVIAAVALAAAFPKFGAAWLAPFGAAALFWTWQGASWRWAAALGWLAGMIFFAIDFAWIGHTVGSYIGPFGPFLMIGAALLEAPFFALAGILATLACRYARPELAPLAGAAGFAVADWLRSVGELGAPFYQLGYTQADSPLRAIAAYAGTYGITFVLCVAGAYLADALRRRTWRPLAIAFAALAVLSTTAWFAWPARRLPVPTIQVAAIQGNIAQSLKWNSLDLAVTRYEAMTRAAAARKPKLIVWPETVIPTVLDPVLMRRFLALAAASHATIVAGSLREFAGQEYNSLFVFQPDGTLAFYDKRQLVPFAETFPLRRSLSWLPYAGELIGRFSSGHVDGVYRSTALTFAPLICWESTFSDLAFAQLRRGAQLLVISTDDAWFGTTSGPYAHAQIAQLRAIESGAYVVRAAATGISGIIAPDGTWQTRSRMEERIAIQGKVGPRVWTLFGEIGPTVVALALAALYLVLLLVPRRNGDVVP
ncbi:MAG TPA: apolipoprotein N-acyltransferase [Candidatus Tumulicola sp.]|jgi:apolipoprotein N-acyltransferase